MKIAKTTWDKYSPAEQEFFQKCIASARGVREIKALISGIKKRFGSVRVVEFVKFGVVVYDSTYFSWIPEDKQWVECEPEIEEPTPKNQPDESSEAEEKEEERLEIPRYRKLGVILDNSSFARYSLMGKTTHRYWLVNKDKYQDKVLLLRVGDFCWTFAGDAVRAAKATSGILSIEATSNYKVALWGFPSHAYQRYIGYLSDAGYQAQIVDFPAHYC